MAVHGANGANGANVANVDRSAVFRALSGLSTEQCEAVATELRIPRDRRPEPGLGGHHRAAVLLQWAEREPRGVHRLASILEALPHAERAPSRGLLERLRSLPARLSRAARERSFARRYARSFAADNAGASSPGLRRAGAAVPLREVWIEPRLSPSPGWRAAAALHKRPVAVGELLGLLEPGQALAIVAPAGAGKTELLRRLGLRLASGARPARSLASLRVPLLLRLPDLAGEIAGEGTPLGTLAQGWFADEARGGDLRPPAAFFENALADGRALVLLDDGDALPARAHAAVAAWIDRQVERYPRSRFVLATTPDAWRMAPLARAQVARLVEREADEVRRYARAWYRATTGARRLPKEAAHGLRDLLERIDALPALAKNPLLLSLLALVHRREGRLPGERLALLRAACDSLLEWLDATGDAAALDLGQRRAVLLGLAAHMMELRASSLPTLEAAPIVEATLRHVRAPHWLAAPALLKQLAAGSGLLVESPPGAWRFAHPMLQQCLCAAAWLERGSAGHRFAELVGDPWWSETLRFYATEGDAGAVIAACLENAGVSALQLALACVDEGQTVVSGARRAVEARVDADLESPDPDRQQVAAEARLARRLREMERLDERRAIDRDYVSAAEYQLFLDELGAEGDAHRPDHWLGGPFPSGGGLQPHLGVRPGDAEAFCAWLGRRGSGARFRLPTAAEVGERPTSRLDVAPWCREPRAALASQPPGVGESSVEAALAHLATLARPDVPPPAPALLRGDPSLEAARVGDELRRNLALLVDASLRQVAVPPSPPRDIPLQSIQDLRKHEPPDPSNRDAVLALLRLIHRALGCHTNDLESAHYAALRRHAHLDYTLVLELAFALAAAHLLPRFVDVAVGRGDLEPDPEMTSAILRPLSYFGQGARELFEQRDLDGAARELERQLAQGVPAQDRTLRPLAELGHARIDLLRERREARRAAWRSGAVLALHASDLARRKIEAASSARWKGTLPGELRGRRFAEWASGPLLDLHWWAQLTLARADGRLLAWEGIRLVRDWG